MKILRIFSLLISLITLLLVSSLTTRGIQAQEPAPSIRAEIETALARAVAQRPAWLLPGSNDFIIDHLGVDGDQAYIIANRWPTVVPQDAQVVSPDILLAVAQRSGAGWSVYLQGSPEFTDLLTRLSPQLIEPEARDILLAAEQALRDLSGAATVLHLPGLPWQAGQTWKLHQGLHGSNNGLDLAPPTNRPGEVYAADKGTLVGAYDTCLQIKHSTGVILGYQHIDRRDVTIWREKLKRGETAVKYQEFIGRTTIISGCAGTSTGHHVHFYFGSFNPIGSTFNGWKLQRVGNRTPLSKNDKTVFAALNMSAAIYFDPVCAGCALPPDVTSPSPPGHFIDIGLSNHFYPYIEALYAIGAVNGYSDKTYRPAEVLDRGSAAKIIIGAIGEFVEYTDGQCAFVDVCPGDPFYHYIRRAKELFIISGFSDGTYRSNNPMTRGGLAKLIILGRRETPNYPDCQPPFPDVSCSYTFYDHIRRLKEIFDQKDESIGYSDGTYRPDEAVTRDAAAKLVVVGLDLDRYKPIFYDVLYDNQFYHYINAMARRGITSGCDQDPPLYCLNDPLTRGQVAKFIIRGMGEDPHYNDGVLVFPDVPTNHTFYHYIRRLKQLGITAGFSDGTYRPDQGITRAEIAKFIVRALKLWGVSCRYNQNPGFSDVSPASPFFADIQCLKELKITSGYSDGTYKPNQVITRAGAAKFIYLAFIQRTSVFPQEPSNTNNNSCHLGVPTYTAWAEYIIPGIGNDKDCFKLPLTLLAGADLSAQAAKPYRLAASYTGVNADLRIEILASDGKTILARTQGQGEKGEIGLNWTPPRSGTYYVRLSNTNTVAREGVQAYFIVKPGATIYLPFILSR